ncbi:uncharacterized protein LOC129960514 isoform X2 [Argiope bruennichi]|nr:uncharacterized protein LOC129960514 isoform X2 [Argiope bruennichi]
MKLEMGTMSTPSDRDIYIINEVIASPKNDQPIDLRVRSVIQRNNNCNNYNERQAFRERPRENLILASLLTKTPSHPTQIQQNSSLQPYTFPKLEQNARNCSRSLTSRDMYLNIIPAYYGIPQPQFEGDTKQSIVEKLNINRELTDEFSDHKSWNINACRDQSSANISSSIRSINVPSTSFRSVAPDIGMGIWSNFHNGKNILPKYWKYHTKYSNQPSTSRTVPERVVQNQRNSNPDQYSIIRERLTSNPIIQPPQSSFNNSGQTSSRLYRLLQKRPTEHTQSLKRKLSYSVDTTQNDTTNHKTLRGLLSTGKKSPPTNENHFQNRSFYQQGQMEYHIKTEIKTEPPDEDDEIQVTYQQPTHARYHQKVNVPSQVMYYPNVIRTTPSNVLKGLLVSNCKTTPPAPKLRNILPRPGNIPLSAQDPSRPTSVLVVPRAPSASSSLPLSTLIQSRPSTALPTRSSSILPVTRPRSILQTSASTNILSSSGPPSSGSPGSESTSSGSTDSGVFSDNLTDDRRRLNRVMSGRHVKTEMLPFMVEE